ncbi:MAG: helix-turn-helix domain-containing protein [Paludibacter sp.]|nr:helix-turn-helix domain-containing protein [Paludibacter sp.]
MDYKKYLEDFVADIYKKFDEEEVRREEIVVLKDNYGKAFKQLDELTQAIKESNLKIDDPFVPNDKFMKLMDISTRTSQVWRDEGKIGYSQIAGKIYFRKSDIEKLLNDNYHKAKVKGGNKK